MQKIVKRIFKRGSVLDQKFHEGIELKLEKIFSLLDKTYLLIKASKKFGLGNNMIVVEATQIPKNKYLLSLAQDSRGKDVEEFVVDDYDVFIRNLWNTMKNNG